VNDIPFLSVVIPTFNRAQQVQSALRSVLAQTYQDFEVIIIDDGSSDGTGEAIQKIVDSENTSGKQVRYFFQPNRGQSIARNKGADEARGEWIAFLDSDDVWLPEKLEWQVRAIDQFSNTCWACFTDARLIDNLGMDKRAFSDAGKCYEETLGVETGAVRTLVKRRDPFWTSTLLVQSDIFKQIGSFDPSINYAEDHDLMFRLSLVTPFCYVNKPLCVADRSKSPQGSTCRPWDNVEVRLRGSQAMLEKWLKLDSKLPLDVREIIIENLRQVYSAWANWYLEHEQYEEARQAVSKAVTYQLTTNLVVKWGLIRIAPGLAKKISPKMRVP
jgi:glycosyltransferase involved in cell wall biosynthesis